MERSLMSYSKYDPLKLKKSTKHAAKKGQSLFGKPCMFPKGFTLFKVHNNTKDRDGWGVYQWIKDDSTTSA